MDQNFNKKGTQQKVKGKTSSILIWEGGGNPEAKRAGD